MDKYLQRLYANYSFKKSCKYINRSSFFAARKISIAEKRLSLDNIEHGILRRSKVKWSLGYINKLFPSMFEKEQRVDTMYFRIHFALNCGAKSCPLIAFYQPEKIDAQLDMTTMAYLQGEAKYNEAENTVALPAIMGWFRGDFGGKKNMVGLLHHLQIVPKEKKTAIRFKKYNRKLFLEITNQNNMSDHYYNAEDLKKFGAISDYQKELGDKFFSWYTEVFKDSALSAKEKSLIALAVAHAVQCPYCIDAYSSDAYEKGWSQAQMMEALHVTAAIRGGASLVHGVQMMNKVNEIAM